MAGLISFVPLCITILLVVTSGNAQLTPVIGGVQNVMSLNCEDVAPEPDYAYVMDNQQCPTVALTIMDIELCQDYKVYEVHTPLFFDGSGEPWGISAPGLSEFVSPLFHWKSDYSRLFISNQDAFLLGQVYSTENPDKLFEILVALENGVDYQAWINQNTVGNPVISRTYRDTYGYAEAGGNLWNEWSYYEIDGDMSYFSGDSLLIGFAGNLTHIPSNYLFGFQFGEAANGHNEDFGFTMWAGMDGWVGGQPGTAYATIDADLVLLGTVGELYCSDVILRTWTATDDCGLSSRKSQLVLTEGGTYPSDFNGDGTTDALDFVNFNSAFGNTCSGCPEDLNADGIVDIQDFLLWNSLLSSQCD